MKLALLLLIIGSPEIEKTCPATVIWMPCEACPACPEPLGVKETRLFSKCMRGPGVRLHDVPGHEYIPCEWIVDCAFLDRDQDGYLDLKDYSMWQASVGK